MFVRRVGGARLDFFGEGQLMLKRGDRDGDYDGKWRWKMLAVGCPQEGVRRPGTDLRRPRSAM